MNLKRSWFVAATLLTTSAALFAAAGGPAMVNESARKIPIAYNVDVVVIGGSTGAVAAATEAARCGARVFLATPLTYLGEDMTATLRLWLKKGETPTGELAKSIFAAREPVAGPTFTGQVLPFTYKADLRSDPKHKDTSPPSRLCDGKYSSASRESVQYDGDVTVTVDLGKVKQVKQACVLPYSTRDFQVAGMVVSASDDGKTWRKVADVPNTYGDQGVDVPTAPIVLSADVGAPARYLRFHVTRAKGSSRLLLGEIVVLGPEKASHGAKPAAAAPPAIPPATPMQVKRALDDAMLKAKVPFLYGCFVTDVLRDAAGQPCGVVMANRAGRQVVLAKVIIDATDRAWVARQAGATFAAFPAGKQTLQRVVIGGEPQSAPGVTVRRIDPPYGSRRRGVLSTGPTYPIYDYTLHVDMPDGSYASWARADQQARDLTYCPDQQFTSDVLFQVPPDPMKGRSSVHGKWPGADKVNLDAFRPAGVDRLWVLGGCADLPRAQAAKLLRPLALMEVGSRIGRAAAEMARSLPAVRDAHVATAGLSPAPAEAGDVREVLAGVRPFEHFKSLDEPATTVPVVGRYDVVVIGGGTSGCPAGIAAARHGARVLVVEYQHALGGVGTVGAISSYCNGYRGGFTAEVGGGNRWAIQPKMEWWRTALRKAGADIWFGAIGCGALRDGDRVRGVVVATPQGRGVVLAKVVVDATGNADIAVAAGADWLSIDPADIAVQGTGLPPRNLGARYTNTDFTITDETDMLDVWRTFVYAKFKYPRAFDLGKLVDSRERRCVVGDFVLTALDEMAQRTYPDIISQATTNFDTHGYTVSPYFELVTPGSGVKLSCYVPYRCLLPKGLDGLLVTGLGVSARRDALPLIRMQADMQNLGYATGCAAVMAARRGGHTRQIDLHELQKHLVQIGNVPASVLTDKDSFPVAADQVARAVPKALHDYKAAAIVLAQPGQALPRVRAAYARAAAGSKERLGYAHLLALLGDPTGEDDILAAVEAADKFDKGWRYTGMGQYGRPYSNLDTLIIVLGRLGDRRAVPAIVAKCNLLTAHDAFSHARAIALALGMLGDPAAAGPLAAALRRPGMSGHVLTTIQQAVRQGHLGNPDDCTIRSQAIREVLLAAALLRCGDQNGLGRKILTAYTHDLRGYIARYAAAVLAQQPGHGAARR